MKERCRADKHEWERTQYDKVVKSVCKLCGYWELRHDCREAVDALSKRFPGNRSTAIYSFMDFSERDPMWIVDSYDYGTTLISYCPFCGLDLYAASDDILGNVESG